MTSLLLRAARATGALLFVGSFATQPLRAQQTAPPPSARLAITRSVFDSTGVGDTSIFAPLMLPAANSYRSGSGAPGHAYWQNRADYDLRATLDTAEHTLRGAMTLRYTNNSPDTLRLRLDAGGAERLPRRLAELADLSARTRASVPAASRGATSFERIVEVTAPGKTTPLTTRVEGTMMKVDLARPLAPHGTASIRHRLALPDSRARRRPHGARRLAVRTGAVVSAHGGLRRRARLEHRAVSRAGRVLSRVRRLHARR